MKKFNWNKNGQCTNPEVVYRDSVGLFCLQIMVASREFPLDSTGISTRWIYGYRIVARNADPVVLHCYCIPCTDENGVQTLRHSAPDKIRAIITAAQQMGTHSIHARMPDDMLTRLRRYVNNLRTPNLFGTDVPPVIIKHKTK